MATETDITRRFALKAIRAAGFAAAMPISTAAAAMSAQDRMRHHLAEFQKAAQEHDPRIKEWVIWDYAALTEINQGAWMIVALREPTGEVSS